MRVVRMWRSLWSGPRGAVRCDDRAPPVMARPFAPISRTAHLRARCVRRWRWTTVRSGGLSVLFRLLGPLEVSDGDHALPIGEGRQRAVLVLLLLHRNETVSSDRLIDALWGETPPPTAAKVLQNHVGQLRRALDDREGQRLQTRDHGYRASGAATASSTWSASSGSSTRAVRRSRASDPPTPPRGCARRSRCGAGLLWPTSPTRRSRSPRSSGSRSAIPRRWSSASTPTWRSVATPTSWPSSRGSSPQHPLRERLRAQLMVALYRCGRQADALEAYAAGAARPARRAGRRARPRTARAAGGDPAPGPRARAGAWVRGRARRDRPRAGSRSWPPAARCWSAQPWRRRCSPAAVPDRVRARLGAERRRRDRSRRRLGDRRGRRRPLAHRTSPPTGGRSG